MSKILQAIPGSFYSRDLYRRVAREWRGVLGYMTVLLLIVWGTQAVAAYFRVRDAAQDPDLVAVIDQLPHMVIEDGVATVDIAQPYVLPSPDREGALVIFDTTGRTTDFDERSGPGLIFVRDRLLVRTTDGRTREFPYAPGARFEIDKDIARSWADWGARWAAPVLSLAMLVIGTWLSLIYRMTLAVVLAALWTPFCGRMGVHLPWWARFRVAAVAMTPTIVIDTVLVFAARALEQSWAAALALAALNVVMVGFGLSASRDGAVDPPVAGLDPTLR